MCPFFFLVFSRFLQVRDALSPSPSAVGPSIPTPARYSEVKKAAVEYQQAKGKLNEALFDAGCGHWIEKPVEQDQFSGIKL